MNTQVNSFYTENVRIIANKFVKDDKNSIAPLNWLVGKGGFTDR